ncbi:MAG: efflux RND transporter periplasmic adaptor subunit [Acidobacteria bacterium]|nr:efflux RND transporter periplasmic adaptor subunit [Acidobacteriota bacterium]
MNAKRIVPALLVLATVIFVPACRREEAGSPAKTESQKAPARKYQCPMHPEVVKDEPGTCPICNMDLVPIEASGAASAPAGEIPGFATVKLDARKQQLLGVKTAVIARGEFSTSIKTVGRVAWDERRVHHVHTRFEAYVEHVTADFTGKFVRRGEELARVYSPELYATQQEYLLALKASRSLKGSTVSSVATGGDQLLDAARQRLLLWEITPEDIRRIEEKGEPIKSLPVYAPISGYVTGRTAYHGMKVMPSDSLFDIVDLTQLWVLADVYEYELPRLKLGQKAEVTLSYWPGRSWKGTVTYIFPSVDEKTRTVTVRIEVPNPAGELKPEMFADVVLTGRTREVLKLPEDAVIDSGTRKIVFVSLGDGELSPREVALGDHTAGFYEVLSGLESGDSVLLGANFLVDSESRLKSAEMCST